MTGPSAAAGREPLLVFVHVPKTAGTTLGRILTRQYPGPAFRRVTNYLRDADRCRGEMAAIARGDDPHVLAVQGHVPVDACAGLPAGTRYVTFLRDPVERALSQYFHIFRKRPRGQTLEQYLAEGGLHDNLHTRMLSGQHPPIGRCNEAMLAAARDRLETFAVVGLTERFDESLVALRFALGWRDVLYRRGRVNPARGEQDAISADARRRLEDMNALDAELYRHAERLLEAQLRRAGDAFQVELEALGRANAWYAGSAPAPAPFGGLEPDEPPPPPVDARLLEAADASEREQLVAARTLLLQEEARHGWEHRRRRSLERSPSGKARPARLPSGPMSRRQRTRAVAGALLRRRAAQETAHEARLRLAFEELERKLHLIALQGPGDARGEKNEPFLPYLLDLGKLAPDAAVLDIGCGWGPLAGELAGYLGPAGTYHGVDVREKLIGRLRRRYANVPNFHFHLADLENSFYNPQGASPAAFYRFPFADASIDLVVARSLFTHMVPDEVEGYLSEIGRVLRPGGRSLTTYYLLDEHARAWVATVPEGHPGAFPHDRGGTYRIRFEDNPLRAVALDEPFVRDAHRRSGLSVVEPIRYGSWSQRREFMSRQDVVVAASTG